jgi:hypothetical protein
MAELAVSCRSCFQIAGFKVTTFKPAEKGPRPSLNGASVTGGTVAGRSASPFLGEDEPGDSPDLSPKGPDVGGSVAEILDLLSTDKYCPEDDPWVAIAKELVEKSIDQLVEDFVETPYLHRVEHSIHARKGKYGIKTAYAWRGGGQRALKRVSDQGISQG